MVYPQPILTRDMAAYPDTRIRTTVSLVLSLVDELTNAPPQGSIRIDMDGDRNQPVRNPSGYYVFTDLEDGTHTLATESQYYFPESRTIEVPLPDPKNPVIQVTLKPMPCYPFPEHATLVRGLVTPPPVPPAAVTAGTLGETLTDEKGEFALHLPEAETGFITLEITRGPDRRVLTISVEKGKAVNGGTVQFP
jgi:hypothetical protein